MPIRFIATFVLLLALSFSGCAQVKVTKLPSEKSYIDGVRFYRGLPYLAVMESNGQCSATVIYLPDTRTEYVARITQGIGSVNLTTKLEGGMLLTEFGATSDSKVSEILVSAITGLAAASAADMAAQNQPGCQKVGLYWLEFDPNNGRVKVTGKVSLP